MMDILYVVGKGSDWNNNELRYSLRSIAKNGRNIGRVFLVGYKPDFVSDNVIHIPCDDPYDRKHKNILHKVIYAIEHSDIAPHFLISSDDHYYVLPTDFDNLPVFYRYLHMPEKVVGKDLWNEYCCSLHDTRGLLLDHNLSDFQTNPHCNTHFDVAVFNKYRFIFDEAMRMPYGGELNCIMGNLLITMEGVAPVRFNDSKLYSKVTMEEIEKSAALSGCLSSADNVAKSVLTEYLEKKFNTKCKYEK